MAALKEHCDDCERFLKDRCEDVNVWIDELFRKFGPYHREWRHHRRGVEEAEKLFGERGRKAAIIHILRDCGHVPKHRDYVEGKVDELGFPKGLNGYRSKPFNGYWDPWQFIEAVHKHIGMNDG